LNFDTSTTAARPQAFLIAMTVIAAIMVYAIAIADQAAARTGGGVVTTSGDDDAASDDGRAANESPGKYERLYKRIPTREKRWARKTSQCESGGNPDAIGGGGIYRGAFQFMRSTWKASPKTPGGDPVAYSYRTQAVVAVALKKRDGAGHWPVCG
jgi:hypothetical protein